MRYLVLLILLSTATVFAQPDLPTGQTRLVLSSATGDVGSPLFATGSPASWGIISEINNPAMGIGANEFFFAIDENGQLSILQPLSRMFSGGASGSVEVTLEIYLVDAGGMTNPAGQTVTVTVVEDVGSGTGPSIPAGQTRNIIASAEVGDPVGSPLASAGSPTSWAITGVDNWAMGMVTGVAQDEIFFDIDNSGQLIVFQDLERFFPTMARADQLFVHYEVTAYNDAGASAPQDIIIYVVEGATPIILGSQVLSVVTNAIPGAAVGEPLTAIGDPTYWSITGGFPDLDDGGAGLNPSAAFSIAGDGQISTSIFLDQFFYNQNPTTIFLTVVAGNTNGQSTPVDIQVNITAVGTIRCGLIPAGQTRYVSSVATIGGEVGFPIDMHGIDNVWIDSAWINTGDPIDVSTFFSIEASGGGIGQIFVLRDLSLLFPEDQITQVNFQIIGHAFGEQCPQFISQEILVYVLPNDTGGSGPGGGGTGGGTGTNDPDFSTYIDDPVLLSCILETLGLSGSDPLTAADVLGTTQLDCACRNDNAITDIDGIQLFSNLTELNLSNNLISDIRPVAGLNNLTDLRLAGNMITDVTTSNPLASLANLVYLDLSQNQIRNSNAFSTLQNIQFLSLAYNDICEIGSLAALAALAPNAGINAGDTIHLDGNRLLNTQAQTDLSTLEATGAFVTAFDNVANCPTDLETTTLPDWPFVTVIDFTELINYRAPCN